MHAGSIATAAGGVPPLPGPSPRWLKLSRLPERPSHVSVFNPGPCAGSFAAPGASSTPAGASSSTCCSCIVLIAVRRLVQERAVAARRQDRAGPRSEGRIAEQKTRQPALVGARAGCAAKRAEGAAARRAQRARRRRRRPEDRQRWSSFSTSCRPPASRRCTRSRAAIDRFKATGKQVVAWGSGYDQRQYYSPRTPTRSTAPARHGLHRGLRAPTATTTRTRSTSSASPST